MDLVPTLCPLAASPFDFSKAKELIEQPAQSMKKCINEGGLTRRSLPENWRRIVIEFQGIGNLFTVKPSKRSKGTGYGSKQS